MKSKVGKEAGKPFASAKILAAFVSLFIFTPKAALAVEELRIVDDGGRLRTAAKLADGTDASVIVSVTNEAKAQIELSLNDAQTNKSVQSAKVNSDGIATFLGVNAGTYQLAPVAGLRITGVQIAPSVRAAKESQAGVAAASAVGGVSVGAVAAGALAFGGIAAGVSESKKGNGGGDAIQQQPEGGEVRGGAASHDPRADAPPPVGTISPAPGPGQTTVNDTPDNITGPNGPLPGSEDPTQDTPNPPAPQNPPPLSGS